MTSASDRAAWARRAVIGATFLVVVMVMRRSEATYTVAYTGCSSEKCIPGSQYWSNVNSLLREGSSSSSSSSSSSWNGSVGVAHGVFECSPDCPDCRGCVSACVAELGASCPNSVSGAVRMGEGCYVRYDNATFMGVEDKTVVLRRCGAQQLGAGESGPREAVLAYLEEGTRAYRKGAQGGVTGLAGCVAGLTQAQCQDCLEGALALLTTACPLSAQGDVYLSSCYARYSALIASQSTLPYNPPPPPNFESSSSSSSSKSVLGTEKTLAIIIGIIAIIGVIVIFFFILRKYAKDDDDDGCNHACSHK